MKKLSKNRQFFVRRLTILCFIPGNGRTCNIEMFCNIFLGIMIFFT